MTRKSGWAVLALIMVSAAGASVEYLTGPGDAADVPAWRTVLGWSLVAAGTVAGVVLFRRSLVIGWVLRPPTRPLQVLSSSQRRNVMRQIEGRAPLVPAQLPVTTYVATALAAQPCSPWVVVATVGVVAGDAARHDHPGWWIVLAVLTVALTVGAALDTARIRRARTFLHAHPIPVGHADG